MREITAYVCEFCLRPKPYKSKTGARGHENRCYRNPEMKACATCGDWQDEFGGNDRSYSLECAGDHQPMGRDRRTGEPKLMLRSECPYWVPIPDEDDKLEVTA